MRNTLAAGRSFVLLAAVVATLSGCLGDNCRPSRGWDGGRHGHHDCDRDQDHHRR
jgi:hypothetical protein